ncbi:hypothetical protein MY04_1821 [Flammeovirga sp. MY04]|uniref:hypothetical protein n=1 Tax=Flammeovirga sp. MY04 TaxID=1191459 RepID=UPI0008062118|nr:hypothetical protein [Flammeovirga sp. MY04]ANQ49195.1 hypothetical protein MY04_1821 [Flammeovirga sp. MY04]
MNNTKLFQGISVLLHPIFIPCFVAGLFLFGAHEAPWLDTKARWSLFSLIGTITTLLPISCLLLMQRFGIVQSPHLHNREERSFALSIMILALSIACYILLLKINVSNNLNIAFITITITLIVATIFNFLEKISLHCIGMSGFIGLCLYFITSNINAPIVLFDALGIGVILLGIVMTARLYLKAHTNYQVYLGTFIGLFCGYFGAILSALILEVPQ